MLYKFILFKDKIQTTDILSAEDIAGILLIHGLEGAEILNEDCVECYGTSPEILNTVELKGWDINSVQETENANWVQQCEQVFESVQAGVLSVQPVASSASVSLTPKKYDIYLIPGLGFGTGHHATTKTALEILQHSFVESRRPKTALDVGTGSGILAIGLSMLYDTDTTAFDIDEDAVENAKENVEINKLSHKIHLEVSNIKQYSGSYDIVIANIYAEVLVELKNSLLDRVNHSGILVISGIMEIKRNLIYEHFCKPLWNIIDERIVDGWVTILLEKRT